MGHCSNTLLLLLLMFFNFSRNSNYLGEAARPLFEKLQEPANQGDCEENEAEIASSMIGSMPPRCEGRCYSCSSHCEAVQVPVVNPQSCRNGAAGRFASDEAVSSSSRDESSSNYKPMSWKCKCDDTLINP